MADQLNTEKNDYAPRINFVLVDTSEVHPVWNELAVSQVEAEIAAKRAQGTATATGDNTNVGPFQLGISPEAMRGPKVKPWKELTTGGKAMRVTARASNLTVILIGAGLSAVLVYALATELFAKNSPTVIYGESCDRIRSSHELARFLIPPYKFHNNPPSTSSSPPRHRNRHISSQVAIDSSGREHLFLHFYLDSTAPSNTRTSSPSWFDSDWNFSYQEAAHWLKSQIVCGVDACRASSASGDRTEIGKSGGEGAWSFAGIFSSLKGKTRGLGGETDKERGLYTSGEVHIDLVKDDNGIYQYRYILVDIPSSRSYKHKRVFVERDSAVRDGDNIVMWESN
ncbi:mitochondrial import inner membrane translocase subunit TIM21 [Rhizoctonia solani]|uniref:Mitochondrial import inner membrane translocase subunit Tim21 n=1 Tax=Rhizoctonia solani TaxID=456999 RepID=A0A8H8T4B8_9AGAM|nr:mitochondrial import inner membrane translocase subunit TIM21 [Rhizoctonia solani]QRW27328.1 mitochondrial import inner membrane translocase subunit TIM21 [Rhizoctonia solani]